MKHREPWLKWVEMDFNPGLQPLAYETSIHDQDPRIPRTSSEAIAELHCLIYCDYYRSIHVTYSTLIFILN